MCEIVVQISRFADGSRRLASVSEVLGFDDRMNYDGVPIYEIQPKFNKISAA